MMRSNAMHLIVGADSMVGRALTAYLLADGERVAATTRRKEQVGPTRCFLDLAQATPDQRWPWPVEVAWLCAGITGLDACRNDPVGTARINVDGVLAAAASLAAQGAFVIYLSSNRVFDGSLPRCPASAPLCPQTEYGRQKAAVEKGMAGFGAQAVVVRFTKIISADAPLLRTWVKAIRERREVRPFTDMVMAPVPLSFAVEALARVGRERDAAIVQVSAEDDISYEQAARHLIQELGGEPGLIRAEHFREAGLEEPVPAHTSLDTTRLRAELGLKPPTARQALNEVLAEWKARTA